VLIIYLSRELLKVFSRTRQQRNFATFLDEAARQRGTEPDPTPAMTAIRTLEFEDEFIETSLHALPVRFHSGESDLLSC
jgi:hypothetical protein